MPLLALSGCWVRFHATSPPPFRASLYTYNAFQAHTAVREVDDETFIFYEGVTWGMWFPFRTSPLFDAFLEGVLQNLSLADVQPILDKVCAAPAEGGGREERSVGQQEHLDLFIELYRRLRDSVELARSAIWDWKRDLFDRKVGNPPVFSPGFSQVPGGAHYMNRNRIRPNILRYVKESRNPIQGFFKISGQCQQKY